MYADHVTSGEELGALNRTGEKMHCDNLSNLLEMVAPSVLILSTKNGGMLLHTIIAFSSAVLVLSR